MKNLLCILGLHRKDKNSTLVSERYHKNGKKYHRRYIVCKRCGKPLYLIKNQKRR